MKKIISILFCFILACGQKDHGSKSIAAYENDSITFDDRREGARSPDPPYEQIDTVYTITLSRKAAALYMLKKFSIHNPDSDKMEFLNKAIELDSFCAEAYMIRGTFKNMLESTLSPTSGCSDICRAFELGYPRTKLDNCKCKE